MTHRQRMMAAIRGEPTDQLPWAPRLDLWFRANQQARTLPPHYRSAALRDFLDDAGIGFHAVVPDFRDLRSDQDDQDRGLGIFNLHMLPYRTVLENVERTVQRDGDRMRVQYITPVGTVSTTVLYDDAMRRAGITITHVEEHAFKTPADYDAIGTIFENLRVAPNVEGYQAWADYVGDRGIAVAMMNMAASPMQAIQRDLMPLDTFFLEMYDHPDELARLVQRIDHYYDQLLALACECPADVFFLGGNYDATVTYPPFFAEHIQPWLRKCARALHAQGKFLLTHTDGENTGLLELYLASEIDIADAICPAPMTRLSLQEHRETFNGRITIMGGVPSVALLESTMSDAEFSHYIDGFFETIGRGDHLILGISDTTPPAAPFERIAEIAKRVEVFGPVNSV